MRSWSHLATWKRTSGSLSVLTEHDFQRAVLPYLRVWWPAMVEAPDRKWWDRCGVDLLTPEKTPFECIVQCKGFHVQDLGPDQTRQVLDSIDSFQRSDVSAECYIVVHNRDGRFRDFANLITARMSELVQTGRVARAELWDRQMLLNLTCDRLQEMLSGAIHEHAERLSQFFDELLPYAREHVQSVPVRESEIRVRRGEPLSITETSPMTDRAVSLDLLGGDVRWTLLTGAFGAGKTTTVLQTALTSRLSVLVVPCSSLPAGQISNSTNLLLEAVAVELGLLGDLSDQDCSVLANLAGGVMSYVLSQEQSEFAVVFDGLDENRVYSTFGGLQRLMNQLADVSVPVVLTTRGEHFCAMFGDFSASMTEISHKKGKKPGRLLELGTWNTNHVERLLKQISRKLGGEALIRMNDLLSLVKLGQHREVYEDLLDSPLFVQFVVEDVIENGVRASSRVDQLRKFVGRKIYRDRATRLDKPLAERLPVAHDAMDTEELVAKVVTLSENVAGSMVFCPDGQPELIEFISSARILEEARRVFDHNVTSCLGLLLHSFFLPRSFRKGAKLDLRFAFRILQEYFLASYLVRENLMADSYPEVVQSLWREIRLESQKKGEG